MNIDRSTVGAASRRLARLAGLAVLCAVALSAPQRAAAAPPATTAKVEITKFAFAPMELTVAPGTRVVWTNHDETPHSVKSDDNGFSSTGLDTGDTYAYTFAKPGDYAYICSVHPFMKGVVHVRAP